MADDIPIEDAAPQGGNQSIFSRVDSALNSFFKPINSAMSGIMGKPDWRNNLMMGMNAMRPGGMGSGGMGMMPRIPNQPQSPPNASALILRMLQERANPMGVLESTRMNNMTAPGQFRPMSFDPRIEQASRLGDAMGGTKVLTPANRSPNQNYNLAIIRQLMGGGQ